MARRMITTPWTLSKFASCLCVCKHGAYADSLADAVDRLLILTVIGHVSFIPYYRE